MKFALDSNIILYFEGLNDLQRQSVAVKLVERIGTPNLVVPVQALAECISQLGRAPGWTRAEATRQIGSWFARFNTQDTTRAVFEHAQTLTAEHGFQIFDGIILSAAQASGSSVLISEDMQDGFTWRGVTIVNPFAKITHPLIASILETKIH